MQGTNQVSGYLLNTLSNFNLELLCLQFNEFVSSIKTQSANQKFSAKQLTTNIPQQLQLQSVLLQIAIFLSYYLCILVLKYFIDCY